MALALTDKPLAQKWDRELSQKSRTFYNRYSRSQLQNLTFQSPLNLRLKWLNLLFFKSKTQHVS